MNEVLKSSNFGRGSTAVDEFLRRGSEVHAQQRKRVLDLEEEYQRKRTVMTCEYARKMSDLANEGAEALRALDSAHRTEIGVEHDKLAAITRLRDE